MSQRVSYHMTSLISFSFGFFGYLTLETVYKRYVSSSPTHFAMGLLAGVTFLFWYYFDERRMPILVKMLLGGILVTALELPTGIILNRMLHLGIWDYSHLPFHVLGQICPRFSFIWCVLTYFVLLFNRFLKLEVGFLCQWN